MFTSSVKDHVGAALLPPSSPEELAQIAAIAPPGGGCKI